ncbi:MAG: hypothetical protein QMD23_02600 [Candidatus Bathyarchaeia archaeon]|nr:hypothetical protein [Candidatus Bathyarchaeia archaeon]
MGKRTCANCGKEKDVSGGKECQNGHFICRECAGGGFLVPSRRECPLCGKPLR